MQNMSQAVRAGLFFVFGLALLWIVYETLTEASLSSGKGYKLEAHFEDLKQLKIGAEVRMAGVSVGVVRKERLDGRHAVAGLGIDDGIEIPSDSVATITTAGVLGNNYVAIAPGNASTYLAEGDIIKTEDTPDINEVIAQVGKLGDQISSMMEAFSGDPDGGPGKLFNNLNTLVEENSGRITSMLSNFDTISERLVQGEGTAGKFLSDDTLYDEAAAFFAEARGITQKLDEGKGALGMLLNDEQTSDKIELAVNNIAEFSQKLNSNESTLGRLISSDELYVQAKDAVNKVDAAVESVQNSGPITAVGVAAGALF